MVGRKLVESVYIYVQTVLSKKYQMKKLIAGSCQQIKDFGPKLFRQKETFVGTGPKNTNLFAWGSSAN